jgi:hypothetical protein
VILRLVRRPYGLHAIGPQDHAIIQTHASHRLADPSHAYQSPVAGAAGATRTGRQSQARLEPRVPVAPAIFVILRLVRRPYGLHAIGPQDHAIIQTHASHKVCRPIACVPVASRRRGWSHAYQSRQQFL